MNERQYAKKLLGLGRGGGVVRSFLDRFAPGQRVSLLENPTEELLHDVARGKQPRLFSMAGPMGDDAVLGRVEENYLYSTRRFPLNTANNTIGGGAVTAQDYLYFTMGLGDQGANAGYFSIANLTLQQTNMASGGKIPNGRGFRLFDLGISFNAQAIGTDIAQMLDIANLRFEKQNSSLVIQHGPLKFWPGGTGLYGFAATAVGGSPLTIQSASNGMPALTNVRRFRSPRVLSANDQFQYVVNCAAATPNSNTTVALLSFVEVTIWLFGQVLDKIAN
jgi:hypothetical protein